MSTPSWYWEMGVNKKQWKERVGNVLPYQSERFFIVFFVIIFRLQQMTKQLFHEDRFHFLHLRHQLIVSHYRNPAWRESRFSAWRGPCISTPQWILIKMKLWSKCGWRSSLSHCCTPSPSTFCPASAPRTSAAPPTRLCRCRPAEPPSAPYCPRSTLCLLMSSCRVKELSHHFSEMNPVRQKWIYMFFMYPFLSGDGIDGKHPVQWQLKYAV